MRRTTFWALAAICWSCLPLEADVILPKYWERIKPGMGEVQLRKLMGEPVKRIGGSWYFGPEIEENEVFSHSIEYLVEMKDGKVLYSVSPFGKNLSRSGSPVKADLLFPIDKRKLQHGYPVIDLRWSVVSGEGPMHYLLEVERKEGASWRPLVKEESDLPYFALLFRDEGTLRWRVKGKNGKGTGPWSTWGEFVVSKK